MSTKPKAVRFGIAPREGRHEKVRNQQESQRGVDNAFQEDRGWHLVCRRLLRPKR